MLRDERLQCTLGVRAGDARGSLESDGLVKAAKRATCREELFIDGECGERALCGYALGLRLLRNGLSVCGQRLGRLVLEDIAHAKGQILCARAAYEPDGGDGVATDREEAVIDADVGVRGDLLEQCA